MDRFSLQRTRSKMSVLYSSTALISSYPSVQVVLRKSILLKNIFANSDVHFKFICIILVLLLRSNKFEHSQ